MFPMQFAELRLLYPSLGWMLAGQAFFEAATGAVTVSATMILFDVGLGDMVGLYILAVLLFAMVGPCLFQAVSLRFSIKASVLFGLAAFSAILAGGAAFATTPRSAWGVAPLLGVTYGHHYSAVNALLASLVPGGQESEIAGLNLFSSAVLSWLPPLVLTVLNERGLFRLGLFVMPLFWLIGAAFVWQIDLKQAARDIEATLARRERAAAGAGAAASSTSASSSETREDRSEEGESGDEGGPAGW